MNKPNFTPGPWRACCLDARPHYVFGEDGLTAVCSISVNDPEYSGDKYEPMNEVLTIVEARANACLMQAAPDMYDLLCRVACSETYASKLKVEANKLIGKMFSVGKQGLE